MELPTEPNYTTPGEQAVLEPVSWREIRIYSRDLWPLVRDLRRDRRQAMPISHEEERMVRLEYSIQYPSLFGGKTSPRLGTSTIELPPELFGLRFASAGRHCRGPFLFQDFVNPWFRTAPKIWNSMILGGRYSTLDRIFHFFGLRFDTP